MNRSNRQNLPINSDYVSIVEMTAKELSNKRDVLQINYRFENSYFGRIIIASTYIGICYIAFVKNEQTALLGLKTLFPFAKINKRKEIVQASILPIINADFQNYKHIVLHVKATDFQLNVWTELLKIPFGRLRSYSEIAQGISNPKAVRAVGTAVSKNPISLIIPCHRVIKSSGELGKYYWGSELKKEIIDWEATKLLNLKKAYKV